MVVICVIIPSLGAPLAVGTGQGAGERFFFFKNFTKGEREGNGSGQCRATQRPPASFTLLSLRPRLCRNSRRNFQLSQLQTELCFYVDIPNTLTCLPVKEMFHLFLLLLHFLILLLFFFLPFLLILFLPSPSPSSPSSSSSSTSSFSFFGTESQ